MWPRPTCGTSSPNPTPYVLLATFYLATCYLLSSFFLLLLDGNEALLAWRQKVMELPLMEDLAGGKRGVVPLYSRLEIGHQVAQVVALLHQCDIVHGALTLDQVVMVHRPLPSTPLFITTALDRHRLLNHDVLHSTFYVFRRSEGSR